MPGPTHQIVELPLTGGVDQHTDTRKLPLTSLARGENIQIVKTGGYTKRYGFATAASNLLQDGTTPNSPATLHARGDTLLVAERGRLLSRSPAQNRLVNQDMLCEWTGEVQGLGQNHAVNVDPDIAYNATRQLVCIVWGADGASTDAAQTIYAAIVDDNDGSYVLGPTTLSSVLTGYVPHVVSVGDVFVCVWHDGAGSILGRRIDVSVAAPSWDASVTLETDAYAFPNAPIDIAPVVGSTTQWVLGYMNNSAGNDRISLSLRSNAAGLAEAAAGTTGETLVTGVAFSVGLAADLNAAICIAYSIRTGGPGGTMYVRFAWHNVATLVSIAAPATIRSFVDETTEHVTVALTQVTPSPYRAQVAWSERENGWAASGDTRNVRSRVVDSTGALLGINKVLRHAQVASKLFVSLGKTWLVAETYPLSASPPTGTALQHSAVLVDMYGISASDLSDQGYPRPVCTLLARTASQINQRASSVPSVVASGGSRFQTLVSQATKSVADDYVVYGTQVQRTSLLRAILDSDQTQRQHAELGGLTYLSGGVPSWFDGRRVGEVSFLYYPYAELTAGAGGSLNVSSTYTYGICYVQYDNAGNVHRSAPFIASVTLGGAQNRVTLTIGYLGVTTREDSELVAGRVGIEIYRGVAGSSILRLLTNELSITQNDRTLLTFTYTDDAADSTLTGRRFLYTTRGPDGRGALDNVCPPSARLAVVHRGRLWLAGCPDRKELWVSKQLTPGEAPGFNEELRFQVDEGGDITALASMDDKLIVFKRDRIHMITGDGPDDGGAGSDWSQPIRINGTVGCIDPRSVVVAPIGIFFQSAIGISLLTRGLEVVAELGAPIEDTLAANPTVVYAILHDTLTEVRFGLQAPSATSSVEVRYDYRAKAWFTAQLVAGATMQSAVWAGTTRTLYVARRSPVTLYNEDTTLYTDAGSFVTLSIDLGPLRPGATQGYQGISSLRFWLDRYTDADCNVYLAYDGGAFGSAITFTAAEISAMTLRQIEVTPTRGKSSDLRIRLEDALGAGTLGTGRGWALYAAAAMLQPKGELNPQLPAANRR